MERDKYLFWIFTVLAIILLFVLMAFAVAGPDGDGCEL